MVSYLINSCGFAPEKALSASKHLSFNSPEKPNSVILFFKNQGLSDSEVIKVVKKYPKVLDLLPERNLLPKIEFLRSYFSSQEDLASVLVTFPNVLGRSLKKQIIPSFEFLVNLVGSSENSITVLKRCPALLVHHRLIAPNVDILLEAGVPMENITGFLKLYPAKILQRSERYKVLVDRVREIGIHPTKFSFLIGVMVMSGLSKLSWERKIELFKSWGCSEEEVLTAFKIHPWCMMASVGKIEAILKFLVNEMGWETLIIMKTPLVLAFSLKGKIIPRCSVLHVLMSEGLIKDAPSLLSVLMMPEMKFLSNYVKRYEKGDQELLKLYNEKVNQASLEVH
ncbi:hypothetical protein Leryth_011303 [Lithospermum erythrorhizon]|nr:hypothetical protein Leryth_011303 [Lithospermum erythrorhizon]